MRGHVSESPAIICTLQQVHVSNALGCINPVTEVAEAAHAVGAKVLVDGCQSVPNMPVDVQVMSRWWDVQEGGWERGDKQNWCAFGEVKEWRTSSWH